MRNRFTRYLVNLTSHVLGDMQAKWSVGHSVAVATGCPTTGLDLIDYRGVAQEQSIFRLRYETDDSVVQCVDTHRLVE